jgi:hypothetical protein
VLLKSTSSLELVILLLDSPEHITTSQADYYYRQTDF